MRISYFTKVSVEVHTNHFELPQLADMKYWKQKKGKMEKKKNYKVFLFVAFVTSSCQH